MSGTKKQPAYRREKNHSRFVALIFSDYRRRCRLKTLAFNLTLPEFESIISGLCYLCGNPPLNIKRTKKLEGQLRYNGIDRIDNSLGYMLTNCKPCCYKCNRMKSDETTSDFITHLKKIITRHK